MNKELFIECLNAFRSNEEKEKEIGKLLISENSVGWIDSAPELKEVLIKILKEELDDKYDYIDEWLYGIDDNKRVWEELDETHDIEYNLNDPEDLWYYLKGEYKKVKSSVVTHEDAKPMTFVDWSMIKKMWDF